MVENPFRLRALPYGPAGGSGGRSIGSGAYAVNKRTGDKREAPPETSVRVTPPPPASPVHTCAVRHPATRQRAAALLTSLQRPYARCDTVSRTLRHAVASRRASAPATAGRAARAPGWGTTDPASRRSSLALRKYRDRHDLNSGCLNLHSQIGNLESCPLGTL